MAKAKAFNFEKKKLKETYFFRFDAGSWFRYDDTVVTETNDDSVR